MLRPFLTLASKAIRSFKIVAGRFFILDQAIRIDPANIEALCAAAAMQYQLHHFVIAELDSRAAVAVDPKSPEAWTHLGIAQSAQNHFHEALWSFEKAAATFMQEQ